jgi:hypothetical protein
MTWPNCGRSLKVTASIWPSSRRSSCASFLCFGTFGRILIVHAGNKKVRSLFASDRTYGFFFRSLNDNRQSATECASGLRRPRSRRYCCNQFCKISTADTNSWPWSIIKSMLLKLLLQLKQWARCYGPNCSRIFGRIETVEV